LAVLFHLTTGLQKLALIVRHIQTENIKYGQATIGFTSTRKERKLVSKAQKRDKEKRHITAAFAIGWLDIKFSAICK
jgi:hypothetical protein